MILTLLGTPKLGFAQISSTTEDLVLRSGTQEVLLDFTGRDKHRKSIDDIRSREVEIYDDGVKQSIRSFSFRDDESPIMAFVHASLSRRRLISSPGGPVAATSTCRLSCAIQPLGNIQR